MARRMDLVVVEHADVRVVLKGEYKPALHRELSGELSMRLWCSERTALVDVYDGQQIVRYNGQGLAPIFFENDCYELLVLPSQGANIQFGHENVRFQQSVREVVNTGILTGRLDFQYETGLSSLHIYKDEQLLFTLVIEVFPMKLDDRSEYQMLLQAGQEEMYDVAYRFLKRTHEPATYYRQSEPSYVEFYRLLEQHVQDYVAAVQQVEQAPQQQLETSYEEVSSECLSRQSSRQHYMRQSMDRRKGALSGRRLRIKKQKSFNTVENRYVKWTLQRLHSRLQQLRVHYVELKSCEAAFVERLDSWLKVLGEHRRKPFWRDIGELERTVYRHMLQPLAGYNEVQQLYIRLSQSMVLQSNLYTLSVQDVAIRYTYWTFLKLSKQLSAKPDIQEEGLKKRPALYVQAGQTGSRTFQQLLTGEVIQLYYERSSSAAWLMMEKQGKGGPRFAFHTNRSALRQEGLEGASCLAPATEVLPFLPNEPELVAQFIDHVLYKSEQQLQQDGSFPKDTLSYLMERQSTVLVLHEEHIQAVDMNKESVEQVAQLVVGRAVLPIGAIQVQEIAIANDQGIHTIVEVIEVEITEQVTFRVQRPQPYSVAAASTLSRTGIISMQQLQQLKD